MARKASRKTVLETTRKALGKIILASIRKIRKTTKKATTNNTTSHRISFDSFFDSSLLR
jgi:hypothetical protein